MSRSNKRTPITGNCCGDSEKNDKRIANRRLRRIVKSLIAKGIEFLPVLRDVSNVYTFNKDGKHYWKKDQDIAKRK